MNKALLMGALLAGLSASCAGTQASVSPSEQLAVHFGARGEMHAELDALQGDFEVKSSYWGRAGGKEYQSVGHCEGAWDDSGLCISNVIEMQIMDSPVQVDCSTTWDDIRGCYVGLWSKDDGHTIYSLSDGHMDGEGQILTVRCEGEDTLKEVLQVISEDQHVREIHRVDANGNEFLQWRLEMNRIVD